MGFEIDKTQVAVNDDNADEKKPVPQFMDNLQTDKIIELDVHPVIENRKRPAEHHHEKSEGTAAGFCAEYYQ